MKSTQLKRILVPVDFSPVSLSALHEAIFIARLFKAELYIMHVIDIPPTVYTINNPMAPGIDVSAIDKALMQSFSDISSSATREYSIKMKTLVTHGKPAREIVATVEENRIDLVIMGTHGAHGFDEYFIGSNAHKVITLCPCPVITVQRKSSKSGFSNILFPIDNAVHSREKINFVLLLAKAFGSHIHILGLPDTDNEKELKKFNIKITSVEKLIEKAGLAYSTKLVQGSNVAELSLKHAKKVKADMIAIMSDEESRYGIFIGPFAKQLVNHSRIPVLSIKPSTGFFEYSA